MKKWKRFEQLVYEIQRTFVKNAIIKINDHIKGVNSCRKREIDISIRQNIGQYPMLIILECKDFKRPIDVEKIEAFANKIKDVEANQGAFISNSGFTRAAINSAVKFGIKTYRLIDTKSTDWKTLATIPVLLVRTAYRGFRMRFSDFDYLPQEICNSHPKFLKVYDNNNFLGTLEEIAIKKLNDREIDNSKEFYLGEKTIKFNNKETKAKITLIYEMPIIYYFGNLKVDLKGFKDEQGRGVITKEILTNKIIPYEIEQGKIPGWKEINKQDLAIQPFIILEYSDHIK
ncbi:MAG: hypothetical protein ACD_58C00042G0005 [uncultured bacterium]|jgi:hypothetical protein|nr:MAG: hypothetical protein ACD_58C00042G0005 [uncultured bacterium]